MQEQDLENESLGLDYTDKPLVKLKTDQRPEGFYVLISHEELDWLVASLMFLMELDSDVVHRNAMKGEIKSRCRAWLDDCYATSGYVNHQVVTRANVVPIDVTRK